MKSSLDLNLGERAINGVIINEHERVDDLHRNGLLIIQDPKRFCFGIDAVILSSFCKVKKGDNVLDLGTGTGIIPILLAGKTNGKHFTGIEIQSDSAEMANRSILMNQLQDRIRIDKGDLNNAVSLYGHAAFDVICSNPPYMETGGGIANSYSPKAIAKHEVLCTLENVISSAHDLLRFGGRFYMVHRPRRLTDILCLLRQYGLETKNMRFVHAFADKPPVLVLLEAARGGNPSLTVDAPLIIYESIGKYTSETESIYYGHKH